MADVRGRLPLLPLPYHFASLAERSRHWSSKPDRRVRLSHDALGNRLTVGHLPLKQERGGSSPPSRTPGQLLLVVTPRSERGGRWFDSSPRNSSSSPHGSHPAGSGACLENRWRRHRRLWVRVPRLPPL